MNKRPGQPGKARTHIYQPNGELTPQEVAAMWLVAEGLGNKAIAERMGLSDHTAKFHICNAVTKLGYTTRTGAATKFVLTRVDEARTRFGIEDLHAASS